MARPLTQKAQERAEMQRDRILNAAQQCFIEHGFHASMANIADTAAMSAGLIYRYFENKNAIILAIIDRQLQGKRADIAALQAGADLAPGICEVVARWQKGDPGVMNPSLFLEMSAQASRDPQIAHALGISDRVTRADFGAWLEQAASAQGSAPTDVGIQARALALQCLVEGLAIRAVREPELDPALVAESLELFLPGLLFDDGNGDAPAQ